MIKIVLFALCLFPAWVLALVPVEGILRGQANLEYQQDPLRFIFPHIGIDNSEDAKKVKLYSHRYQMGDELVESCRFYGPITYGESFRFDQAKRSVAATLQYLGLDTSIKAIGALAREVGVEESGFENLAENAVNQYCSKNLSVFSLKTIKASLKHYYQNPVDILPKIESSPYATESFKNYSATNLARQNEFEYAIEIFRDFCSWGGEIDDYRMMGPYLANRFFMSVVIENLTGKKQHYSDTTGKVYLTDEKDTLKVNCEQLICRKTSSQDFSLKFPLSIGSSGLKTDLEKLYCHQFRYLDYRSDTIPEVKAWIKSQSLEAPIFRQNFLLSLISGVPDPFMGMPDYKELPFLAKSNVDERWMNWAKQVLNVFSGDLLFEESLKINVKDKSDYVSLVTQGYSLDLFITLGEMDRMLGETDKLSMKFDIKLSKSYLLWLRKEWSEALKKAHYERQSELRVHLEKTLTALFRPKEEHYLQKIWNDDLFRVISGELLNQISRAPTRWFEDGYQDKMIQIPVKFYYGVFALNYLKYRADSKSHEGKLSL